MVETCSRKMHFFSFQFVVLVTNCSLQSIFHKKAKKLCQTYSFGTDGLYDWKSFYEVKNCFNLSLQNRIANIYVKLKNITSQLHNTSVSIAFIKKALSLKDNSWIIRIVLTDSCKLMKNNLMKHVQDLYNSSK